MKIIIILGTRPEIIKMAPIIRGLEAGGLQFLILHTGQHYSHNLDKVLFQQLQLPDVKYNLEVGSGSHAEQTAKILIGVEEVLENEVPDIVLVEGDTNSVLAGALAASKLHLKLGHVEAGLRSFDKQMPEEINRILTDHCSDYLFAPTNKARSNLLNEGISEEQVYITGNTVVDAVYQNLKLADEQDNSLDAFNLIPNDYVLVTLHRQENVDDQRRFADILKGLERVANQFSLPVIYPIHPRSRKRMSALHLKPNGLTLIDPIPYLDFLQLESNARPIS